MDEPMIVSGLRFEVEWEDAGAVRAPELRATWCRLEAWVDGECVTRVEDATTMATRRSIYVPLYPLAEWIAYHWWALVADHRPTQEDTRSWTYETLIREPAGARNTWLKRHNFRNAGDGHPWPDLTLVPDGATMRLAWRGGRARRPDGLSYLSTGSATASPHQVQQCLTELVQTTIGRLDEMGIGDTTLHQEWDALANLSEEERAYCRAVAQLGLDPFSASTNVEAALIEVSETLPPALIEDFLDTVDPSSLLDRLSWVTAAREEARALVHPLEPADRILAVVNGTPFDSATHRPWEIGYEHARSARRALGLASTDRADIERYVGLATRPARDRDINAVGESDGPLRVVCARQLSVHGQRFTCGRALWHGATGGQGSPFLLTRRRTARQQMGRSFAAELLAPAAGIREVLPDPSGWDSEDVADVADHFGVHDEVVIRQLQNDARIR